MGDVSRYYAIGYWMVLLYVTRSFPLLDRLFSRLCILERIMGEWVSELVSLSGLISRTYYMPKLLFRSTSYSRNPN